MMNAMTLPHGSTSPITADPRKPDGRWYAADFPTPCTIRDNVRQGYLTLTSFILSNSTSVQLESVFEL